MYGRLLFLQMGPINKTLYDYYPKVLISSIIILQKFATVFISYIAENRKTIERLREFSTNNGKERKAQIFKHLASCKISNQNHMFRRIRGK